jgi:hypothetical protein
MAPAGQAELDVVLMADQLAAAFAVNPVGKATTQLLTSADEVAG